MGTSAGLALHRVIQAAARLADEQGLATLTRASLAQQLGGRSSTRYPSVAGLPGLRREGQGW
ncbi:hypothetical protein [Thermogemmatispora tikiterensis]|uniref:HTH tetR-type domain-containing protein n=1 Tax=Thermogemmatispora tikiterensis TaxID=1825093 RepID=A0A328VIW7_9CHLR|nr:hypothetical protein [Thermogemmatispora tikiterensis]RAQ94225.1 hypothetical protein A4R35_01695 [Thermogemmatispora tikiterensis]